MKHIRRFVYDCGFEAEFITAGDNIKAANQLLDISAPDRPTHIVAPITILG